MKTITTIVYEFDELNEKAKEKARDWFREHALDYDWYEPTYDDAANVGIKITGFDLGRPQMTEGHFTASAEETARKIEKEHGETCETYTTAKAYLKQRDEIVDTAPRDAAGEFEDTYTLDGKLDELDREFLHDILEDYRVMLEHEMEYLTSDESADEAIRANEYTFTEDGKRF